MQSVRMRRAAAWIALGALALLVSACLLSPGRFTSELDIRRDGGFSFAYAGEIHLLALSKLADLAAEEGKVFEAEPCHAEDNMTKRPCSARELTEQRRAWEEERRRAADKRRQNAESMKSFLGGIDPASPRAAEEFAQRLRRQRGWRKVVYKGDGLFEVDFAISGRLDHDFTFPTIERFPMGNAFVQIALREDGTVRVDAPGFGPTAGGEPFRGMMQAMPLGKNSSGAPGLPVIDGHFTLRTDGTVLANNTDEGPQPDMAAHRMEWAVNLRSPAAPTALIRLR